MLVSAIMLFRRRGIDGTSIGDVIAFADAPRGSIYHHFPGGKPQLAEEATRRAGAAISAEISRQLTADGPMATIASVVDLFRKELESSDFESGCPIGAGALEGGGTPGARTAAGESFTAWESVISAGLWQHGIALDRAESLASMVIAAIEGAIMLAKAQRSTHALDRVETELTMLLSGLL
ncbi:TetR/AcrR family transcriptional regulator [Nocardiaceae bacterium YC2-7]|uniref:TetR/AcrR family transcriptional regulator n=2 Tax=Antrihabitans stalactiti TaxID=2584121 RepID=A0A848KTS8_9NOCA|nr:TetR/AcrR family transcriptional regulator [Antrihabitans stalactiti]NMN99570.1 TetR/AcrR family transcriptional regulator [Antrihabitans stalactiti]